MAKNPNNKPRVKGQTGNQSKVPQKGTPRSGGQQSSKRNARFPKG